MPGKEGQQTHMGQDTLDTQDTADTQDTQEHSRHAGHREQEQQTCRAQGHARQGGTTDILSTGTHPEEVRHVYSNQACLSFEIEIPVTSTSYVSHVTSQSENIDK